MKKLAVITFCVVALASAVIALPVKKGLAPKTPSAGVDRPQDQVGRPAGASLGISGLVMYVNAKYGVYSDTARTIPQTTDGAEVAGWKDWSPSKAAYATQATSGQRPLLIKNGINGQPVLRFDGVDDYMTFTLSLNGAKTVVMVGELVAKPSNGATYLLIKADTPPNYTFSEFVLFDNHAVYKDLGFSMDYSTPSANGYGAVDAIDTNPHIYTTRWAGVGNNPLCSMDGGEQAAIVRVGASFGYADEYFNGIGARPTGANLANPFLEMNIDIAEIMVYNRYLTNDEMNTIGNYARQAYGLTWGGL